MVHGIAGEARFGPRWVVPTVVLDSAISGYNSRIIGCVAALLSHGPMQRCSSRSEHKPMRTLGMGMRACPATQVWLNRPEVKTALHVEQIVWADHDGWDQ